MSLSTRKLKSSVTFGLISFFMIALLFGIYSRNESQVFAAKSVPHYSCGYPSGTPPGKVHCCGIDIRENKLYCTDCDDTQPPSNCSSRYSRTVGETTPPTNLAPPKVCPDGSSPDANGQCPPVTQGSTSSPPSTTTTAPPKGTTGAIEQPPTNLAPPSKPQTTTCPDGSTPDANGVCPPPTTTGNQNPQSLTNNNGGSNGNSNTNNNNNNNVQSQQQNNKGSNLLGHAGELAGSKKGSSPTPPPCPTDNSPIPPNCTLKPKI